MVVAFMSSAMTDPYARLGRLVAGWYNVDNGEFDTDDFMQDLGLAMEALNLLHTHRWRNAEDGYRCLDCMARKED